MAQPVDCMLTTVDNPFDYFDDFDSWYRWDMDMGYSTCCYLAREIRDSDDMSEGEKALEQERAIDKIILSDPTGIYKKVTRPYTRISEIYPELSGSDDELVN